MHACAVIEHMQPTRSLKGMGAGTLYLHGHIGEMFEVYVIMYFEKQFFCLKVRGMKGWGGEGVHIGLVFNSSPSGVARATLIGYIYCTVVVNINIDV